MTKERITSRDAKAARKVFRRKEPRDLFYRAATELIRLVRRRPTSLTIGEALAVLLQTWNKDYYRFRKFDNAHLAGIERLLATHKATLTRYRSQAIGDLDRRDRAAVENLFQAFEDVLGPVGAAKALHLLAPSLFPLWDRAIAEAYDLKLGSRGSNGQRYWQLLLISQRQCLDLEREDPDCQDPLKAIDEYNYCKYTKGWLR